MSRAWWVDREHREARNRAVSSLALAVVVAVLIVQVGGFGDLNDNVNGFTIGLLLLAIVLGFAVVSPKSVKRVLDRVTTFKFGGVELGLQAAERLDLLQTPLTGGDDELNAQDDVNPSRERPRGGGAVREFEAVQETLQDRLEFVRDAILNLDEELNYFQIVEKIDARDLLGHLELRVVYDLLGEAEEGVERLPDGELDRYLDRAWRFARRFGTLIFERNVRRRLIRKGWFLLDFEQSRKHRPDFLAYKAAPDESSEQGGDWLLLATRVDPGLTTKTIERLQKQRPPFGARAMVVVPSSRKKEIEEVPDGTPVAERPAVLFEAERGRAWMATLGALLKHPEPPAL